MSNLKCDCTNLESFYKCKFGCNEKDSVQYCKKRINNDENIKLPLRNYIPIYKEPKTI
jgi:hypothetical protein